MNTNRAHRATREIRADYDSDSIVVYQAYSAAIALPAVAEQRFVAPFSFGRMTWLKPSFRWLMHRSQWAQKAGQEHILAIRIARAHWDAALAQGVLTSPQRGVHSSGDDWSRQFEAATVHVQWDTERSVRGAGLDHDSIQVGISRHLIRAYAESWVVRIDDITPRVRKLHALLRVGQAHQVSQALPKERPYSVGAAVAQRLGMM